MHFDTAFCQHPRSDYCDVLAPSRRVRNVLTNMSFHLLDHGIAELILSLGFIGMACAVLNPDPTS